MMTKQESPVQELRKLAWAENVFPGVGPSGPQLERMIRYTQRVESTRALNALGNHLDLIENDTEDKGDNYNVPK